jgi:hypothetical protein
MTAVQSGFTLRRNPNNSTNQLLIFLQLEHILLNWHSSFWLVLKCDDCNRNKYCM